MQVDNTSVVVEVCFLDGGGVGALLYYVFTVCVTGPLLLCGIVGNAVALLVFRVERQRDSRGTSSMTVLLIALSVGNLTMIVFALVVFLPSELYCFAHIKSFEYYVLELVSINWLMYAIDDAIHMFLIYTILGVAVERWLAAYLPIQRRSTMFTCRRIVRYLLGVLVVSVAFQIPRKLEHRVQNVIEVLQHVRPDGYLSLPPVPDARTNQTGDADVAQPAGNASLAKVALHFDVPSDGEMSDILDKEWQFAVETVTQAVHNPLFVAYRIVHTLAEQIVPMIIATIVHVRLMLSLKKAQQCRKFLIRINSATDTMANRPQPVSRIDRGAQLAFITVTLFIICEMPLCVSKVLEVALYLHRPRDVQEDTAIWLTAFHGVAHSIIHLQASLNLILYCWNSTKFRMNLKHICSRRRRFTGFNLHLHLHQPDMVIAYENNLRSPCAARNFEKTPVSRRISNQ